MRLRTVFAVVAIAATALTAAPALASEPENGVGALRQQELCPYLWLFGTYYEFCIPLPLELPI